MSQPKCYRITPNDVGFDSAGDQVGLERELFASEVVKLVEYRYPPNVGWRSRTNKLYLLTNGELSLQDGQVLTRGDLYWSSTQQESFQAGNNGVCLYAMEPAGEIGSETPATTILSAQIPWENFEDPAGRPTQPVQVLLDGSLSALRTRFEPDYIAGEHWHDFDTLYFISRGRMQFGEEGWFEQGDIRAVHGGHSYGPERPGTEGVEFVLISVGGPVALHWSDLEPPP